MTNPTGNWALENLPAFEELYAAIEQMSLEAGAAGDSVKETGSLEEAAPSVDIARERVAHAAATVRECPPPPDAESARHLAALDALDEFRTAERLEDWVQAWTRATEYRPLPGRSPSPMARNRLAREPLTTRRPARYQRRLAAGASGDVHLPHRAASRSAIGVRPGTGVVFASGRTEVCSHVLVPGNIVIGSGEPMVAGPCAELLLWRQKTFE